MRDITECARIVRRYDRERYLVSLFAQPEMCEDLFTVLAVNHEITKIVDVVSDPLIGFVRLQWWQESFDAIELGTPSSYEVVLSLARLAERHPAVLDDLRRVVNAHEADFSDRLLPDLESLENYAAMTEGLITNSMAHILGAQLKNSRELGTAWSLINLVRTLPVINKRRKFMIPESILDKSGIKASSLIDHPFSFNFISLCKPIIELSRIRLDAALSGSALMQKSAHVMWLLAARTDDISRNIESAYYNPRSFPIAEIPTGLIWRHVMRSVWFCLRSQFQ
ncbi:hypothetical protein A1OE_45 [Candidatus Endolissoclinum faulkneri L2]|uniref:Squalene/phytoene synthase family protein n=1 Tax=Candidatus Endolissoclinum faulkneri L2 TaxID=1193729 RepID=K7YNR0_9PROT|nr:squalene/phytoene synthase family protein [Candidatus Endolissoclinum faulkneri]AFX98259.1 hypothetical protein A1OE_45 [Candidatus Endolissoclinum faulkneri L2]